MISLTPTIIRASAGSGKTFQLSSRIIKILALGEQPDRILATTFTRKAAGEIFSRVIERLARAATVAGEAEDLREQIGEPGFSSTRAGELLRSFLAEQHRAMVSTIDAFCVRIISSFGMEMGLPPGWRLCDEGERNALVEEALERLVEGADFEELLELLIESERGDSRRSIYLTLRAAILQLYYPFLDSSDLAWRPVSGPAPLEVGEFERIRSRFAEIDLPRTKGGKGPENANWRKARDKLVELLSRGEWALFLDAELTKAAAEEGGLYYGLPIPQSWQQVIPSLVRHAQARGLERYNAQLRATWGLLTAFHAQYSQLKAERGFLEFDDLKRYLSSAACLGDLTTLYFRLDAQLRHLLLDEFQDTSYADWRIFSPLVDEIVSNAGIERSFFCVGDVKQAIYGWRGGAAELFDVIERQYTQVEISHLDMSRRSSPVLMNYVNSLFNELPANPLLADYSEAAARWYRGFSQHSTAREGAPGYVRIESAPEASDEEKEAEVTLTYCADLVRRLHRQNPEASIGVLVRKNNAVGRILYELRRGDDPIAASGEGGTLLIDSPAVTLLLSVLTVGDHPIDSVARWKIARSALAAVLGLPEATDDAAATALSCTVRQSVTTIGIARYLEQLVALLAPSLDRRDQLRSLQLIDLARRYDVEGKQRIDEFVRIARLTKAEMPEPSVVRVMTIHQSKGLEFDIVVVAELETKLIDIGRTKLYTSRSSEDGTVTRALLAPRRGERRLSDEIASVESEAKERALQDSLSVLYVALTRARTALYQVVAPRTKRTTDFAGLITAALGLSEAIPEKSVLFELGDVNYNSGSASHRTVVAAKDEARLVCTFRPSLRSRRRAFLAASPSRTVTALPEFGEHGATGERGRLQGVALHALFEKVEWLDINAPDRNLCFAALAKLPLDSSLKEQVYATFLKSLEQEQLVELLSLRKRKGIELWRERRFAVLLDGAVTSGVFDRVEVERGVEGDLIQVRLIDFKSDAFDEDGAVDRHVHHYRPQLQSYALALRRMLHCDAEIIQSYLCFIRSGTVVELR